MSDNDFEVGDRVTPYGSKGEAIVLAIHGDWVWIKEDYDAGYLVTKKNLAKVQPKWEVGCFYELVGDLPGEYTYEVLKVSPLGTAVVAWTPSKAGGGDVKTGILNAGYLKHYRKVS